MLKDDLRLKPRLKHNWLLMIEPPWRHSGEADGGKTNHWNVWLIGWAWALAGLVLGAFIAPTLVQFAGLSHTPYQDTLDIGIAVVTGFLVQLLGWCLFLLSGVPLMAVQLRIMRRLDDSISDDTSFGSIVGGVVVFLGGVVVVLIAASVLLLLPLVAVGYALYRYFTWVGTGQGLVTTGFVVGFLLKAFIIPAIWGLLKSAAFQRFMTWLRGKDVSTSKP